MHRDLRLSNILIVDSGVMPLLKIRNFGLAKDTNADRPPRGQVGAALFTAPEVVLNVSGHHYDGELVDSWSCGVVSAKQGTCVHWAEHGGAGQARR